MKPAWKIVNITLLSLVIVASVIFSIPELFVLSTQGSFFSAPPAPPIQFPVTVHPADKTIVENTDVNAFLASPASPLAAAANSVTETLGKVFEWLAVNITDASWYQSLAQVDGRFVTITPGMRKEQVASAFGDVLKWSSTDKKIFETAGTDGALPLVEGSYAPGVYYVNSATTPANAQALVNTHFQNDVLSHYGTSTALEVPLDQALTVASLVERETISHDDMRLISGIIWNRIFAGMNLQIDSTLQYAKANAKSVTSWWPTVGPGDKYRKSPYNTYLHPGLPPTPIANPSVAAILAALNPIKTPCLFYFNDRHGVFHCSATYAEHVKLLKQYYGQGK